MILVGILAMMTSQACMVIPAEGKITVRTRVVGTFDKVRVSGPFVVHIQQGPKHSVRLETDENAHNMVDIDSPNGEVNIRLSGFIWVDATKLNVYITMPTLRSLKGEANSTIFIERFSGVQSSQFYVSGSTSLQFKPWTGSFLSIDSAGASNTVGTFQGTKLDLRMTGAGNATIYGKTSHLALHLGGACNARLSHFEVQDINVFMDGPSKAFIHTNGPIQGEVGGASKLYWTGAPKWTNLKTTGAGVIRQQPNR
jgi:hypothetical protein